MQLGLVLFPRVAVSFSQFFSCCFIDQQNKTRESMAWKRVKNCLWNGTLPLRLILMTIMLNSRTFAMRIQKQFHVAVFCRKESLLYLCWDLFCFLFRDSCERNSPPCSRAFLIRMANGSWFVYSPFANVTHSRTFLEPFAIRFKDVRERRSVATLARTTKEYDPILSHFRKLKFRCFSMIGWWNVTQIAYW